MWSKKNKASKHIKNTKKDKPKGLSNMTQAELESLDPAEVDSLLESTPLLSNTSPEARLHSGHNTEQEDVNHSSDLEPQDVNKCKSIKQKLDKLLKVMGEMKTLMSTLQVDMTDLKTLKQEVHDLKESLQFHEDTISEMQVHEKEMKTELMFLCKVVANRDQMIAQLNTKLLEQQQRSMQKNLIISGLLENEKETDAELANLVDDFFQNILHVDYILLMKLHTG